MKPDLKKIWYVSCVIVLAGVIVFSPFLYFYIQEKQLLGTEKELTMEIIDIENIQHLKLGLDKRREMVIGDNNNIEMLTLKTGDIYSLYEARKQCYRELRKIPVLEVDLYGPTQKEIDLSPKLVVDSKSPVYSMIIWSGSLKIKDILYEIVLDEESGKLLSIGISKEIEIENKSLEEQLEEQWKKYFLQ